MRKLVALGVALSSVACSSGTVPLYRTEDAGAGPADTARLDDTGWLLDEDASRPPPIDAGPEPGVDPTKVLDFSPVVSKSSKPPPISGGTLLVARDGHTVIASDPDRDRVVAVDVLKRTILFTVALEPKSEPGRLVEDTHGVVHVALRGAGAIASIDLSSRVVTYRRGVCPVPRGVAFDPKLDALFVACLGGELVFEPLTAGSARVTNRVASDLRDVLVDDARLYVTRHRVAELLEVDRTSLVVNARRPLPSPKIAAPNTAARLRPRRAGGFYVLHQRAVLAPIGEGPGAKGSYGGTCPPVQTVVTTFEPGAATSTTPGIAGAVVPVDLVESLDGKSTLVVAPGNAKRGGAQIFKVPNAPEKTISCPIAFEGGRIDAGEAVAVDLTPTGHLVVQVREPSALVIDGVTVPLGGDSVLDTGHQLFHSATVGAALACASCHPEGGDDGHVWMFEKSGARRTQSLRGAILATAPFHWDGAMGDFATLMDDGYGGRMHRGDAAVARDPGDGRVGRVDPAAAARRAGRQRRGGPRQGAVRGGGPGVHDLPFRVAHDQQRHRHVDRSGGPGAVAARRRLPRAVAPQRLRDHPRRHARRLRHARQARQHRPPRAGGPRRSPPLPRDALRSPRDVILARRARPPRAASGPARRLVLEGHGARRQPHRR